jgi:FkbM family methyltransferase
MSQTTPDPSAAASQGPGGLSSLYDGDPASGTPSSLWQDVDEIVAQAEPVRFTPAPPPSKDVWSWLHSSANIGTVIDIGANTGDYAEFLESFFKPKAIFAFEPLESCQPRLQTLAEQIPHLRVFQVALADEPGEEPFWENDYGPSSSLLHVSDIHKRAFPHTASESQSRVKLARLDDVLDAATLDGDIFIKIDVQGVEDRVIKGGRAVFSAAELVLIEMSFVAMYESQPMFEEIHSLLTDCGLRFVGMKNQIDDPDTGQPLFVHCFYRRPRPEATAAPS